MLLEFFLERSVVEADELGLTYTGRVPDLPEIRVEASTLHECRTRLSAAISALLESGGETISIPAEPDDPLAAIWGAGYSNVATRDSKTDVRQPDFEPGFTEILYEKRDWVARVTINRPEVYNAYSSTTLTEMTRAFRNAALDDSIAVLVLTGSGNRAFCSGSDVKQHSEEHLGRSREFWKWMGLLIDAHNALRQLGKPSIARINGLVAGGGNEWNLACDLAIAADHAKFMHIETSVGMVAATGATQWLPLVIGDRRAREMLLTGEPISAQKALDWGLVNEVVPQTELDNAVTALCQKLIDRFPECTRYTRQQLNFWRDSVWDATIDGTRDWLALHFSGPEVAEGMGGLAERRAISYRSARSGSGSLDRSGNGGQDSAGTWDAACANCGARGLPASFGYCGLCGAQLR